MSDTILREIAALLWDIRKLLIDEKERQDRALDMQVKVAERACGVPDGEDK